jgi:Eukaryotic-type carbonic anhydrase
MGNFNLIVYWVVVSLAFAQGCSVLDNLANQPVHHRSRRDTNKAFSYKNTDDWKTDFAADCALRQQSPVDISLETCSFPGWNSTTLEIIDWDVEPTTTLLKRTGKTVEFWSQYGAKRPMLTGGVLGTDFYGFYQFHFHWGADM